MAKVIQLIQVELPDNRQGGFVNSICTVQFSVPRPVIFLGTVKEVLVLQALKYCLIHW